MISKVDFRDFFEINNRLYGEYPASSGSLDYVLRMLETLESQRPETSSLRDDTRHR